MRKTNKMKIINVRELQTNPAFWRMIAKRRSEPTISLAALRKRMHVNASPRDARQRKGRFVG